MSYSPLPHPTSPKYQIARLAGYKAKSPKALIAVFNLAVSKWERGGSAKQILRDSGLGEARVANRLKQLMMQDVNLTVAKDMTIHASKMLEMLNPLQDMEGFSISVTRAAESAQPEKTGPDRESAKIAKERKIKIVD